MAIKKIHLSVTKTTSRCYKDETAQGERGGTKRLGGPQLPWKCFVSAKLILIQPYTVHKYGSN
jgi:hypothetical protein